MQENLLSRLLTVWFLFRKLWIEFSNLADCVQQLHCQAKLVETILMKRVHSENKTRHPQVNSFSWALSERVRVARLFGLRLFTQIQNCEQVAYITYLGYASWE